MSFYEYIWIDHHGDLHSKTKIEYDNKIADKWVYVHGYSAIFIF